MVASPLFQAIAIADPGRSSALTQDGPRNSVFKPELIAGEVNTARFRILYTRRSETAARRLAEQIEATRDHFATVLSRDWPGLTEVRLGMGRQEFEGLAMVGDKLPSWVLARAYPSSNVILLEAGSLTEAHGNAVLRHELSHVALGRLGGSWPNWFQEGLAKYLTGERFSFSEYAALFRAVRQDKIFRFEDLDEGWPDQPSDVELAYAQSVVFVSFLIDRHGLAGLGALIDGVARGSPFETEFAKAFRSSLLMEETAWRSQLPARYSWVPILTDSSTIWAALAMVCAAAFWRLRVQLRRRRAEAEAREAAESGALLGGAVIPDAAASNSDLEAPPRPSTHSTDSG
jgi:hypothetical protein